MVICMQTGGLATRTGVTRVWAQTRACWRARSASGFEAHAARPNLERTYKEGLYKDKISRACAAHVTHDLELEAGRPATLPNVICETAAAISKIMRLANGFLRTRDGSGPPKSSKHSS
jgi:hypothetical protein